LKVILSCVIAAKQANWGGVYKFRTTSRISGEQLLGSLQQIAVMTCGHLRGVPLRLRIRPMTVAPVVNGKEQLTTVHVVHCDIPARNMLEVRQEAMKIAEAEVASASKMKRLEIEYKRLITDGVESDDDQADFQEEFFSERNSDQPGGPAPVLENGNRHDKAPAADDPLLAGGEIQEPAAPAEFFSERNSDQPGGPAPVLENGNRHDKAPAADDPLLAGGEVQEPAAPAEDHGGDLQEVDPIGPEEAQDNQAKNEWIDQCRARIDDASEQGLGTILDEIIQKEEWIGTLMATALRQEAGQRAETMKGKTSKRKTAAAK
jgi:hypothetical protein